MKDVKMSKAKDWKFRQTSPMTAVVAGEAAMFNQRVTVIDFAIEELLICTSDRVIGLMISQGNLSWVT